MRSGITPGGGESAGVFLYCANSGAEKEGGLTNMTKGGCEKRDERNFGKERESICQ